MIRRPKPRRVLEIGSGHSTSSRLPRVSGTRPRASRSSSRRSTPRRGSRCPRPGDPLRPDAGAQRVPLDEASSSTTAMCCSSTAPRREARAGQQARAGRPPAPSTRVVVHFHDVFWPYEYPPVWYARGMYANEQYILQAFRLGNRDYRIVLRSTRGCPAPAGASSGAWSRAFASAPTATGGALAPPGRRDARASVRPRSPLWKSAEALQ